MTTETTCPSSEEVILTPREIIAEFKENKNFILLCETFELESVHGIIE